MAHHTLAIVGPDRQGGHALAAALTELGHAAEYLPDAEPLLARLPHCQPDQLLLTAGPHLAPALTLMRHIRATSLVPCIVLGHGIDTAAEIALLAAGADGAASANLPVRALVARIDALLRRADWGLAPSSPTIAVGAWRLLPGRRQMLRPDGSECHLTTAEFDLMRLLVESLGKAVSRDTIALTVFRRPFRAEDRTVDNLVLRLRRKLGPAQQDSIKTVRGAGYLFGGFRDVGLRVA